MLDGATVLVIEEEFLIALDFQRMLEELGAGQVLFARTAHEAVVMQNHWPDVRLALVEVSLQAAPAVALVRRLLDLAIPVVLCSADTALSRGAPQFPDLPLVTKPVAETDLVTAIGRVLAVRP